MASMKRVGAINCCRAESKPHREIALGRVARLLSLLCLAVNHEDFRLLEARLQKICYWYSGWSLCVCRPEAVFL